MEELKSPRLAVSGPARIFLLGESQRELKGRTSDVSGHALGLLLDEPVEPGAALLVEWHDTEVMGEVCSCERTPEGFAVGVGLQHALLGTKELARLARKLLGETEPESVFLSKGNKS